MRARSFVIAVCCVMYDRWRR